MTSAHSEIGYAIDGWYIYIFTHGCQLLRNSATCWTVEIFNWKMEMTHPEYYNSNQHSTTQNKLLIQYVIAVLS